MTGNSYDSGRLNLPFVGICTFGKSPYQPDWDKIDADVAILGAPFDFGTQWRSGARFGPRGIREASTLFSFGHGGAYDHEDDVTYLPADKVRIVDLGDADIVHTDTETSHANIEYGVRKILAAGALPVVLGGDHSINIPCINAFDEDCAQNGPIHIVQFDILSVRQIRALGVDAVLARIPAAARYYVTIDIDGFDPSIAPGTGTPSHGGFLYYDVLELLSGLARRGTIVGIDLVEVAPDYDHTGPTTILAAQILMNLIGRVMHARES